MMNYPAKQTAKLFRQFDARVNSPNAHLAGTGYEKFVPMIETDYDVALDSSRGNGHGVVYIIKKMFGSSSVALPFALDPEIVKEVKKGEAYTRGGFHSFVGDESALALRSLNIKSQVSRNFPIVFWPTETIATLPIHHLSTQMRMS